MSSSDPATRLLALLNPGATIRLGSAPEWFEIPLPEGLHVVGSVSRGADKDPENVHVYADATGDAKAIREHFDRIFAERGYRPVSPTPPGPGGGGGFAHVFRGPGGLGEHRVYCPDREGPYFTVNVGPGDPAPVTLSRHSAVGGWNPCAPQRAGHPMSELDDVPPLSPPEGVAMQGGGGGGSPGSWYATGIAFTDMPPRDLLDHFAGQLESLGAALVARDDGESAAWARWKLPKKDYESIVGIVAAHPSMRLLLRYTYSPDQVRRSERMWMNSGWSVARIVGEG